MVDATLRLQRRDVRNGSVPAALCLRILESRSDSRPRRDRREKRDGKFRLHPIARRFAERENAYQLREKSGGAQRSRRQSAGTDAAEETQAVANACGFHRGVKEKREGAKDV